MQDHAEVQIAQGSKITFTVSVSSKVQPSAVVICTMYSVVSSGEALGDCAAGSSSDPAGLHR